MNEIKNKIMSLVNSKDLTGARQQAEQACRASPQDAELWYLLSAICGHMQDYVTAEQHIRKAIGINPGVPAAHFNLAVSLRAQNRLTEAMDALESVVKLDPNSVGAWFEMGNTLHLMEDYPAAIERFERARSLQPDTWQIITGLASARAAAGHGDAAIELYRDSLNRQPAQAEVCVKLASLLEDKGQTDASLELYVRAGELGYPQADVAVAAGQLYEKRGDTAVAQQSYRQALAHDASCVSAMVNLALLLESAGDNEQALELLSRAASISPDERVVQFNLARSMAVSRRFSEAIAVYERLLKSEPDFQEANVNLGNIMLLYGDIDPAHELYTHACGLEPYCHDACSNMLLSLNYMPDMAADTITRMHVDWAQRVMKTIEHHPGFTHKGGTGQPLKVGYVSADFRCHSVAYFVQSILENADPDRVMNFCYSDVKRPDAMTERLRTSAHTWCDTTVMDDLAMAQKIHDDGIDVLIDLAGHTSGNRLTVFAMRPAPLQITYLGYPNTSGLDTIDYRFVDELTDPEPGADTMVEQASLLQPCFLCYSAPDEAPAVGSVPALEKGYITFGSFNNLAKMNDQVIDAWAKILLGVPGSRLCIKARQYSDAQLKQGHLDRFEQVGVANDRLELVAYSASTEEHLGLYNNIDIALDTFPYNGTTTTFEALWMGVPVLTIRGDRHAARVSASILSNLGLDDYITSDIDSDIGAAVALAADTASLASLRPALRERLASSVLMDGAGFTSMFEDKLLSLSQDITAS